MATEDSTAKDIITNLKLRVGVLEKAQDDIKESVRLVADSMNTCIHGCGLDSYKEEMHQRCQRLTDKIENNKEILVLHKHELENLIGEVSRKGDEKNLSVRQMINRMITTVVVIGIFFGGIIGALQVHKVSQSEYNNHLIMYQDDRSIQLDRFEKRDLKIDVIIEKQQEFNEAISERNIILEGQLNVVRTKIEMGK